MNQSKELWRQAILQVDSTIGEAIRNLDRLSIKIVLVANDDGLLKGTISDGDIRRGLLKGLDLNSPISSIIHYNTLVAPLEMEIELVKQLMVANKVQQIPIVDEKRHILGLHLWDEIFTPINRPNLMVIMAGGVGSRLRPHTEKCPKPLIPISGKPMLEHILDRSKLEGFHNFVIAIHYLGDMIEEYFGDGNQLGVKIEYLREESPLGTAGALGLFDSLPDEPLLVTNGDVITDIRYGEFLDFHIRNSATATMAVRLQEWKNSFGVVQTQGIEIVDFEEKPIIRNHINAGVYVLNPVALSSLSPNEHCDMPTLFRRLKKSGNRIVAYPMHEPWLDVGNPQDLNLANNQE